MKATMRKGHGEKSGYKATGALKGKKKTSYAGAMKRGSKKSKGNSRGY
jgi:hypothetical protein